MEIVAVNLVLSKKNFNIIDEIIEYLDELGVYKICITELSGEMSVDMGCNNIEKVIALNLIKQMQKVNTLSIIIELQLRCNKTLNKLDEELLNKEMNLDYRCRAGRDLGFISPDGFLLPCKKALYSCKYRQYINQDYSLIKNDFWKIWNLPLFHLVYKYDIDFRIKGNCKSDICVDCKYRENKCAECMFDE